MSTQATEVPTNGNGEHAEPEPEQPQSTTTPVVETERPKEEGPKRAPMGFGKAGVILTSLNELWQFAKVILGSNLAPRGLNTVEKIVVAIQFGAEFGVPPMASVRSVAVIEGQPSWKGDMALALVRASGLCSAYKKWHEGEGMKRKAFVATQRVDSTEPLVSTFSVDDAVLAGLWGMTSRNNEPMPWTQYPDRMLYYRALGFNLRDNFPEVMMGTVTAEERADYPPATDVTPISATSSPRALNAAPPPDPLLSMISQRKASPATETPAATPEPALVEAVKASLGQKAPAEETFVLVDPPAPAAKPSPKKKAYRIEADVCTHECLPPSRLKPGKTAICGDCGTELHGDPLPPKAGK